MEGRKLALLVCLAASCGGCVTETKAVPVSPETMANLQNIKEQQVTKREALPGTHVALGRLHEGKARDKNLGQAQQGVWRDEARKAYQKALEIDPHHVEAHLALANLYISQDDHERALACYQRGLQQNPKSTTLWFEAGVCYCRKKDYSTGLQCMGKAHELEPDNHHITTQYGLLLASVGKTQDAVTVLSRVMNRAEANYNVARMMHYLKQPDLSRQYVQAALRERPTHVASLQLQAQMNGGGRPQGQAPAAVLAGPTSSDPNIQRVGYQGYQR